MINGTGICRQGLGGAVSMGSGSGVDSQSNADNAEKLLETEMGLGKNFTGMAAQAPPSERWLPRRFLARPGLHQERSLVV